MSKWVWNIDVYINYRAKIHLLMDHHNNYFVLSLGDFIAHPGSVFGQELQQFCSLSFTSEPKRKEIHLDVSSILWRAEHLINSASVVRALQASWDTQFAHGGTNHGQVPGWNDHMQDLHRRAREACLIWRGLGRPRCGPLYRNMFSTKFEFKRSLKWCRRHKDTIIANNCALYLQGDSIELAGD